MSLKKNITILESLFLENLDVILPFILFITYYCLSLRRIRKEKKLKNNFIKVSFF
jgi:hypothetical protein